MICEVRGRPAVRMMRLRNSLLTAGGLTHSRHVHCIVTHPHIHSFMQELALSVLKLMAGLAGQPELAAACERCHSMLISAERSIFAVQEHNTTSVKLQLKQFIPQDFRGALLESRR